jgi:glycosyltransferase involved in cell wall biosynthesis
MKLDYSVILPVKNGEKFIIRALTSVYTQSLQPTEVLLIDDNSTDDTIKIVREKFPRVQILTNPGKGQASAQNHGISKSSCTFIQFLDYDDYWAQDKASTQLLWANNDPDALVVCSGVRNFSEDDPSGMFRDYAESKQMSASTFRREVFETVGRFQDGNRVYLFEWWSRATHMQVKVLQTKQIHLYRSIHTTNSWKDKEMSRDLFRFLRSELQ